MMNLDRLGNRSADGKQLSRGELSSEKMKRIEWFGLKLVCNFREVKPIDLQLPTPAYERDYAPVVTTIYEPPPPKVFKEKTVQSLDDDVAVPSTFKKRKFGGNKRNVRQKLDDGE